MAEVIQYVDEQKQDAVYKPVKADRKIRQLIYERRSAMESHQDYLEAVDEWDMADKQFRQYIPEADPDDWRAHLVLPDGFAAIQSQMQETIDRKSRPQLKRVEDSDKGREKFGNAILTHNMDRTGFDYQLFLGKYTASIRGTSFLLEEYRIDKREVMDPTDVKDGQLQYTKKEIIDLDDTVTSWIENEWIRVDPDGSDISDKKDFIRREILDIDEFHRIYGMKPDFTNVQYVKAGGDIGQNGFFRLPDDMTAQQVEVLHYYNRVRDLYAVLANNVLVRNAPLPFKHKELPLTPVYHYRIPGRFWGMGIPKVIHALTEERRSIRNLRLDRQKMQINKMFIHNNQFDLDDEDLITRPHGIISINTNGQPLNQAIQPLEYGDIPSSAYKEDEQLLDDIRRAHGIDDRIEGASGNGTATQAAILKEAALKRINLISQLTEMDTLVRVGRLKWSNIQFFYPAPRIERVIEENEDREKKVYKTIVTDGQSFTIQKDQDTGKTSLKVNEIEGSFSFKLDKSMARFMEGDYDVVLDASAFNQISKPIQQSKITEMFNLLMANPVTAGMLDPQKAVARYLEVNDESPENWMKGNGMSTSDWQMLAEKENMVMLAGQVLDGTKDATEDHTLVHLELTNSDAFKQAPPHVQEIIKAHILEEHDKNPATGSSADAMAQAQVGAPDAQGASPFFPQAPLSPLASVSDPSTPAAPFQRGFKGNIGIQTNDVNRQLQPADLTPARPGTARQ